MKIWLKTVFAIIIGCIIAIFLPDIKLTEETTLFNFLNNLAMNLLLYLTPLYVLTNSFTGLYNILTKKLTKKVFLYFFLLTICSLLISIITSVLIMNIPFLKPAISIITQQKEKKIEIFSITKLFETIFNENIFTSIFKPTLFMFPLIFISLIFSIAGFYSQKKGEYFVDTIHSFNHVLTIIARQFLEIFPFLSIFIVTNLLKNEIKNKIDIIAKPFISLLITIFLILIFYFIILYFFFKRKAFKFFIATLGSSLIALLTGNTVTSTIAIGEHIKSNLGIDKDIANSLTPLAVVINKSGTIISSTITLFSIMTILTPDRLSFPLQLTFIIILLFLAIFQDGGGSYTFLIIVGSILKLNFLHLEEQGYVLFYVAIPIFSRLGSLIDSISTSLIILLTEYFSTKKISEIKYIDFI